MASNSTIIPTNRNLPIKLKSRFVVVAIVLIISRMPPVPAAAMPISSGPFRSVNAMFRMGPSHQPRMNVIPSNSAAPSPLSRFLEMANCSPITAPSMMSELMIGLW